jgi:hypothetical protein
MKQQRKAELSLISTTDHEKMLQHLGTLFEKITGRKPSADDKTTKRDQNK